MSRKTGNINEALRTPESRILKSFETAEGRTVLMDAASGIKFIMRIGNYTKSEERSFSVLWSPYFYRYTTVKIPLPEFHLQKSLCLLSGRTCLITPYFNPQEGFCLDLFSYTNIHLDSKFGVHVTVHVNVKKLKTHLRSRWDPKCVFNFLCFFERTLYKSNYIIFIWSWCGTHTKIRSKLVDIVTAGSQKITLWGPQRTPLGILRVKNHRPLR